MPTTYASAADRAAAASPENRMAVPKVRPMPLVPSAAFTLVPGGTVTKAEFIDEVARRANLSKKDADAAIEAALKTIEDTLARGGDVTFTGFGKFQVQDRKARTGVNPRTGERVQIAATKVPKFSAGSKLKASVKG